MKPTLKLISITAFAVGLIGSHTAHAADCKGVSFHFKNQMSSIVKLRYLDITGDKGKWTEQLANTAIEVGTSWTTRKRRMNKLSSGAAPQSIHVALFKLNPATGEWRTTGKTYSKLLDVCQDGHRYEFTLRD